jgi:SNF2 family DNA or RNA helicase
VRLVAFSEREAAAYQHLLLVTKTEFLRLFPNSSAMRLGSIKALSMLGPLRQACSGGQPVCSALVGADGAGAGDDVHAWPVVARDTCCICLELVEGPMVTPCKHAFCGACILAVITASATGDGAPCPLCRHEVSAKQLMRARFDDVDVGAAMAMADEAFATVFESKLKVLLVELATLRARDPAAKVLVFSQFQSTLDWLKIKLAEAGIKFRTLEGSMTRQQRTKALEEFQNDPPTTIFLLSVRAGAVGINLTQANHVYLLDPCLNMALEQQAIGRVHRMVWLAYIA